MSIKFIYKVYGAHIQCLRWNPAVDNGMICPWDGHTRNKVNTFFLTKTNLS